MSPLLFYALMSGLFGYSIHKKWWGIVAFSGCMIAWLLLMQCIYAYMMHGTVN